VPIVACHATTKFPLARVTTVGCAAELPLPMMKSDMMFPSKQRYRRPDSDLMDGRNDKGARDTILIGAPCAIVRMART
jgi:hypothetical protein